MRALVFGLIAGLSLTGCATGPFEPSAAPAVQSYSQEDLERAADELEALPEGSVIARMIADYAVLRAKLRALR